MSGFRVIAISEQLPERVRATRRSPGSAHPVHPDAADGPWACRVCLERKEPHGEPRLLFTYDAFDGLEELPLPGPVFIHEEPCARFASENRFPDDLRRVPLTLNAYGQGRRLLAEEYVADGAVEAVLASLLARAEVAYVHLPHPGRLLSRARRARLTEPRDGSVAARGPAY